MVAGLQVGEVRKGVGCVGADERQKLAGWQLTDLLRFDLLDGQLAWFLHVDPDPSLAS
jgi:hypothetical protein